VPGRRNTPRAPIVRQHAGAGALRNMGVAGASPDSASGASCAPRAVISPPPREDATLSSASLPAGLACHCPCRACVRAWKGTGRATAGREVTRGFLAGEPFFPRRRVEGVCRCTSACGWRAVALLHTHSRVGPKPGEAGNELAGLTTSSSAFASCSLNPPPSSLPSLASSSLASSDDESARLRMGQRRGIARVFSWLKSRETNASLHMPKSI